MPNSPELNEFLAADRAWSEELTRVFGKEAGDVRYRNEARGEPGSELRRRYRRRELALKAWDEARAKEREAPVAGNAMQIRESEGSHL
jgi:hypothetical protein